MSNSFLKERCFLCLKHLELNPKKQLREQLITSHDSLTVQKVIETYTRIELEKSIDNCEAPSVCKYCCLQLEVIYEFTILCNKSQETLQQLTSDAQSSIKEVDATECVAPGSEIESQMQVHLTPTSPETVTTLSHKENISSPSLILLDDETNNLPDNFDQPSSNPDFVSVAIEDNKQCKSKKKTKGRYIRCNLCPRRFSKKSNLEKHASRFHVPGNKRYSCDICKGYLYTKSSLINHIESVHLKPKPQVCNVCKVEFSCLDRFKKHQKLCQKYLYRCNECGKKFTHDNYFTQIKCPSCPNGTDSLVFVRQYKKSGRHKCNQCGKGYKQLLFLKDHIRNVHNARSPLLCSRCGKIFQKNHELILHIKKHDKVDKAHGNYRCHRCNKTFNDESELKPHYEESHPVPKSFRKRDTSKYKYVCETCGRSFALLSSLEKHVVVHTSSEDRKFHCEKCNSYFKRGEHLQNHINGFHLKVNPYSCKYCPETFSASGSLSTHLKIHMVEVKYSCSYCSKSFRNEMYYKKHLSLHTNEKTVQCALCKEFVNYDNLRQHTKKCSENCEETVNLQFENINEISEILGDAQSAGPQEDPVEMEYFDEAPKDEFGTATQDDEIIVVKCFGNEEDQQSTTQDNTKSIVDKDDKFNSFPQATCQYYCDICDKSFESKRLFKLHFSIHKSKDQKFAQQSNQTVNISEDNNNLGLVSITLPTHVLNNLFPISSTSDIITLPLRQIRKDDPLF